MVVDIKEITNLIFKKNQYGIISKKKWHRHMTSYTIQYFILQYNFHYNTS